MARVLLVALVCAVGADDYGGGVPQYGGGSDYAAAAQGVDGLEDYRGHSPDAPAPLDYKYEEDPQGNSEKLIKDVNEADTWNKRSRKQVFSRNKNELVPPLDDEMDLNVVSKQRSERLQPRRRSRFSSKRLRTKERGARRRRGRYGRARDDDALQLQYLDKDDYLSDKDKFVDDDIDTYTREATERTIRRKARDRSYVKPPKSDDMESEDELEPNRKLKEDKVSTDYEDDMRRRVNSGEERRRPMLPSDDESDEFDSLTGRYKSKSYRDYNEYYDMRRVQNIKNKLPTLLRRTTTRPLVNTDLLALLSTARRAGHHRAPEPTAPAHTSLPDTDPPDATALTAAVTSGTAPSRTSTESVSELSIAEKSRLSILKKVQKKEGVKGDPAKKPPVLLQVTSNVPTVVMVEPPTSFDPWKRARLVTGESPRKLQKVMRLMRRKLVADADTIQDLTDNLDEMVCDYIDVSLLDSATDEHLSIVLLCVNFAILIL